MRRIRLRAGTRLTLAYLGVFVVLGISLLVVNYRLLDGQLPHGGSVTVGGIATIDDDLTAGQPSGQAPGPPLGGESPTLTLPGQDSVSEPQPTMSAVATVTAAIENFRENALDTMLRLSSVSLLVATTVGALVMWLVARRALRPLQQLNDTATQITDRNLAARLPLSETRDELRDLGETFNAMLDRLAAAFAHERRLVANASHELATPLANQRAVLEVSLADPSLSADELRKVCESVLSQNLRTANLLDGMLTMARADQGGLAAETVRLDVHVGTVLGSADLEGLSLRRSLDPCTVRAEPFLLDRLVTNLVTNAVRHNVAGGWLEVTVRSVGDTTELTVRNSCEPIDRATHGRLLEPFQRGTTARTASVTGSGLGLSIAQSVASAHGWSLELDLSVDRQFGVVVRAS